LAAARSRQRSMKAGSDLHLSTQQFVAGRIRPQSRSERSRPSTNPRLTADFK
jgi:hypothetical protein